MSNTNATLRRAIIDAYREELSDRYQLENIRRFQVLDPIPDETVEELRGFLLKYIYPDSAERERLDDAFDRMRGIMRSPRRLTPLMKMAFKTVWKLGVKFPTAMATGNHALEACLNARKLEAEMIAFAERKDLTAEDFRDRVVAVRVFASTPEADMTGFRKEVLTLFKSLSDVDLLAATVDIMENSRKVMETRPDLYTEREAAGFRLGYEILRKGLDLFRKLTPMEFSVIIKGIEVVEIDWYDRIKMEAAR